LASRHFNEYDEVLTFIFRQLPMYQRQGPKALKYDLSNILALMKALGNPHEDFKSIHIAGTNGKGSTAHLIAAGFQANTYKTGLYTSPHYKDYRERIKINGQLIDKAYVLDFFNEHYDLILEMKPSYFELSVALAFQYFSDKKVDIAIIEVGLGGRLDSTNIITPLLSVITNISMDHMQTLGDSLEAIAFEKAGIIKNGVPVMVGDYQSEPARVFEEVAKNNNAEIFYSEKMIPALPSEFDGPEFDGPFYKKNIRYSLAALELFDKIYPDYHLDKSESAAGMTRVSQLTKFIGRWQILKHKPLVIADGAHNIAGWEQTVQYLKAADYNSLHIVVGFVADKSYQDILPLLPQEAKYYFTQADIPRALDSSLLAEEAATLGLYGISFNTVKKAYDSALENADKGDLILISGSIFVTGEILTS